MARGVSSNFLNLARREQRLGWRALLAAVALAPLAAFLAELSDAPGYGPVWGFFLACAALGLVAGALAAHRRVRRYEDELRLRWNHWMHQATDAARLGDVDRRVHERDPLPAGLRGGAAVLLLAANLLLFGLLWVEQPLAGTLAWLLVSVDGLVLGALVSSSAVLVRWAGEFVRSAEALVRKGELAMWGER